MTLLKYREAKRLKQHFSFLLCHRLRNGSNKVGPGSGITSYFDFYKKRDLYIV